MSNTFALVLGAVLTAIFMQIFINAQYTTLYHINGRSVLFLIFSIFIFFGYGIAFLINLIGGSSKTTATAFAIPATLILFGLTGLSGPWVQTSPRVFGEILQIWILALPLAGVHIGRIWRQKSV